MFEGFRARTHPLVPAGTPAQRRPGDSHSAVVATQPAPAGTAVSAAQVRFLQSTAGNGAVQRLLAGRAPSAARSPSSVQREPAAGTETAAPPDPLLEEIGEILGSDRAGVDDTRTGAEEAEPDTADDAGLSAELEVAAAQIDAATDAFAAAAPEPHLALQRVKGESTRTHDGNWRNRVKSLGNPLKLAGIDKTKKAKYKAAKVLAAKLDENDRTQLRYKPFRKKSGTPHPVYDLLREARKLNGLLLELAVRKEHLRYYQRKDNTGRKMKALLVAGDNMVGSNTGGTEEAYYGVPQFNARKNSSKSALWIKGHLLNDHMGGSGRSYNLVPLTAEKVSGGGVTGSNDANGMHNKQIEEPLKRVTERPDFATLKYTVESIPPSDRGGPRPQTAEVRKYANAFQAAANDPVHATSKTVKIRDAIKLSHPTLAAIAQPLHTATRTTAASPANAAAKLTKNADLWELEDQIAPHGLRCSAYFLTTSNTRIVPPAADGSPMTGYVVRNQLPSRYTAPFDP